MTFDADTRARSIAAAATATLVACRRGGDSADKPTAADGSATPVTLTLNWYPYGEHAPFYYGVQEGIFAKHGIDLTIDAGQGSTKTVQAVGPSRPTSAGPTRPRCCRNRQGRPGQERGRVPADHPVSGSGIRGLRHQNPQTWRAAPSPSSAGDAPTTTFPIYLDKVGVARRSGEAAEHGRRGQDGRNAVGPRRRADRLRARPGPDHRQQERQRGSLPAVFRCRPELLQQRPDRQHRHHRREPRTGQSMLDATSEAFATAVANPEAAVDAMAGKDPQMPPPRCCSSSGSRRFRCCRPRLPLTRFPAPTPRRTG